MCSQYVTLQMSTCHLAFIGHGAPDHVIGNEKRSVRESKYCKEISTEIADKGYINILAFTLVHFSPI